MMVGMDEAGLTGISQGHRIVEARSAAGLGQAELAERLGVTARTLSRWENDHREPKRSALRAIAEVTGARLEWLLTGQEPMRPETVAAGVPELLTMFATHIQEAHYADAAQPRATSGAPEPGIVALLADEAWCRASGVTEHERESLLSLRVGGLLQTPEDALPFALLILQQRRRR